MMHNRIHFYRTLRRALREYGQKSTPTCQSELIKNALTRRSDAVQQNATRYPPNPNYAALTENASMPEKKLRNIKTAPR